MKIPGYACLKPQGRLETFSYEPEALGPHDIEVEISHCGICFSDVHLIDDDWKRSRYPFIPGHEIVGKITALGAEAARDFGVGDRVGIGWQRSACLSCEFCLRGDENLCPAQEATCVGHHGGFAERIRADGRFAFKIPEALPSESAAPLLCGGATVFAPLRRFGAGPGKRVGVIGIGGLGHMALLFLKAMGAETTAFSSTEAKRAEALAMGADHFESSTQPREILRHANRFDLLLSTVHARVDWLSFIQTLKPGGALCLVGAPPGLIQIPPGPLLAAQRTICGSDIANRATIREMLGFAATQGVSPRIETAPMAALNPGIERLRQNQVRYRMVVTNP